MVNLAESAKHGAGQRPLPRPRPLPRQAAASTGPFAAQATSRAAAAGSREGGGTMELKKDSNAVAIDMLLIVHSEKRRAAQATQLDSQTDPGALLQNRGGNAPGPGPQDPRGTSATKPRGLPAGGRPERGQPNPLPHRCLRLGATAPVSLGNEQRSAVVVPG